MRTIARSCLAGILALSSMGIPVFAANEKPLGMVTQAMDAQLGTAKAAVGTTVYPGDSLVTDEHGTLRLKVGGGQFYLLSSSAATLSENGNAVLASVSRGTVGFSSTLEDQFAIEIPEGVIRAAAGEPAYGQVTITGPSEVVISAYRGSLILDNDGELHTIPAGKSYRVTMDLEPAAASAQPQEAAGAETRNKIVTPRRRHLVFDAVMVGGAAAIGYVLWYHLSESCYTTGCS